MVAEEEKWGEAVDRARRVFFDSVGCRLNQSEIERMARQFRRAGHTLVEKPEDGDLMVLNTCTVTAGADSESRRRVRRSHRGNPDLEIALTGCWATMNPLEARELPGVKAVIPNEDKDSLVPQLTGVPTPDFDREPLNRRPLPGLRMRTRAFVKAQDGCNHRCGYCLTTVARGLSRSLRIEEVVRQVRAAEKGGAKEAVLSGVQLSSYGRDLEEEVNLAILLEAILEGTAIPRVRLSSLEPWGLPEGLLSLLADDRVCRQLHLPLQSGSARTLRRMSRPIRPPEFAELVQRARARVPGIAITTDVLVGFPGETENDFGRSLEFIDAMAFADAHVFPYSARPDTPAADLPDPVPSRVAKDRARLVREHVARSASKYRRQFLDETVMVLWEAASELGPEGWQLSGLTDNYVRIYATAERDRWNELSPVRLTAEREGGLAGVLLPARG